ncbi:isocitrate dehydrogenase [Capnocytophaga haemolytica]|uniref:Isocitrate dehydrogenase [NADP] n=1 Tax=Capnocytophaga haemolytica TaxID=45243 RepID=A0AAX2GXC9_9FLAO|nr:NADP-dependent isocitrate dehydrogenase [Capnocytophaga haemolytica]AMD84890.1 isocitrate dehydrogenase [Capnocytophaga haemolytica]SFN77374.1 isocitrate dehydrogenase [Capnocytophaga haemolytica]SNV06631.1 Isocitrate dehydrogenase [NADP] [Capnocytophaga haemolytica]
MAKKETIIYTLTDEAPFLATHSLLPIIKRFTASSGIEFSEKNISLAGRIIAAFPDFLTENQRTNNDLAELATLTASPEANIIKLPNISASVPQLLAAISELKAKGYDLPDYPENPQSEGDKLIKARYDKVKGSAVNPVLREGNSDRRVPQAVKNYARKHPHTMGTWSKESQTAVATMAEGDFFHSEKSVTLSEDTKLRIELVTAEGVSTVLKEPFAAQKGEIIDAAVMRKRALLDFYKEQITTAKQRGLLLSLHLKTTMMKVTDPILFGYALSTILADVFEKYATTFARLGISPNNGLADLLSKIEPLPTEEKTEIQQAIEQSLKKAPAIAMVNSDKGITNLHVPNDVIIDASMPAMIRNSGKMYNAQGALQDTLALIPDSAYAGVYSTTINFCKEHGAFDPTTMGSVSNVGLMAQKAEEYGSHDKTFEIPSSGTVNVIDESGTTLLSHKVEQGDLWRMCTVKDAPVQDWVKLAVSRAKEARVPTVFWLDSHRAHDAELIKKVNTYLKDYNTDGLEISILPPAEATLFTLKRLRKGEDTISVTGNVLRDYLTDLFPILELETSAKMLSIVPLMSGGGLFETGAGGSAPKLVAQFLEDNFLRWDSLGEYLALGASLEHLARTFDSPKASVLANSLGKATEKLLENNKSPQHHIGEIDTRGSHFYLAMYWAEALAEQTEDAELSREFFPIAHSLKEKENIIVQEFTREQGHPVTLGGYYLPDEEKVCTVMQPSATFKRILLPHLL